MLPCGPFCQRHHPFNVSEFSLISFLQDALLSLYLLPIALLILIHRLFFWDRAFLYYNFDCPWTWNPPASVLQMVWLQVCPIRPGSHTDFYNLWLLIQISNPWRGHYLEKSFQPSPVPILHVYMFSFFLTVSFPHPFGCLSVCPSIWWL